MIRGAIFDFDGTLFDSMFIWDTAGEIYLRSIGIEPEENLQKTLKPMSLHQSAAYLRQAYGIALSATEIINGVSRTVESFYFHTVQPRPGVTAFLEQLQEKGVLMCIATATERYQVEAALRRCGMEQFFSGIFTCSALGHGKDEPHIYEAALAFLGTAKAETMVFEDALHAARTAKAAGFPVTAVRDAHEPNQTELRRLADAYLEHF